MIPPDDDTYPTSLRMPKDLKRRLKRLALRETAEVRVRSLNWIVVHVLEQWANYKESEYAKEEARLEEEAKARQAQEDEEDTRRLAPLLEAARAKMKPPASSG